MIANILILALVTLQRLVELALAGRNTARLRAQGAVEVGAGHYPFMIALHVAWLLSLWWFAPARPISWPILAIFVLLQLGRIWVVATLGKRWTTRIIILPGAPLINRGPFRLLRHPNYTIVVGEMALLPLAFGLIWIALLFSILNAAMLAVRIRAEGKALAPLRGSDI